MSYTKVGNYPLFLLTLPFKMDEVLLEKLKELISPILAIDRVELIDIVFKAEGKGGILRLLVDKPYGITLNECSQLNRDISEALDKSGIIEGRYILEVSSPGADRPIITEKDFLRAKGKRVRIITKESICGMCEHIGELTGVSGVIVTILKEDALLDIPIEKIKAAKEYVSFK